jgi:hypothetical protein
MSRLRLLLRVPIAGEEADLERERMALQPARAPSASARWSFPLAVLPQPRAAPSTAPAHAAPRGLWAPAAAQQHGYSG